VGFSLSQNGKRFFDLPLKMTPTSSAAHRPFVLMASDPISDDFEMSEDTSSSSDKKKKSVPSVATTANQTSEEDLLKEQLKGIEAADEDDDEAYPKESAFPEDAKGLDDPIPWETNPRPCIPAFFHRKLRSHQDLALSKMEQAPNSSSLLAMQMGLGKTATALGFITNKIARYYKEFNSIKGSQHLVVVPKGVVISWQDDFKKFISPMSKIKLVVISEEAGPHAINEVLNGDAHIVVTTYYRMMDSFRSLYNAAGLSIFSKEAGLMKSQDQVEDCHMAVSAWNSSISDNLKESFAFSLSSDGMNGYARDKRAVVINNNSKTPPKVSWVYAVKWSTLAFDESHKIRNSATRNYVAAFFVDAQARVLISGTPIQNSDHDLYTALRLLRVPRFMATGTWSANKTAGFDRGDYLDKMCKGHLIWIRKSDIPGLNMVTKRVFHRGVPFKNTLEEAFYNLWSMKAGKFAKEAAMKGRDKSTLRAARSEVMTAILRCRQACNAVMTLKEVPRKSEIQNLAAFPGIDDVDGWAGLQSTKLQAMMEIVEEHIKDGPKFIILSGFVDMVDLIQEKLKRAGITAGKYTGSLTDAARSEVITKFKTDPSMRCLILSLGAGSLGLSLELADRAIIMDPWWNPQVLKQAEDRIHRINSTKEVRITYLHISGTIEEAIMEVDQQKLEMENAIYEAVNIRALLRSKAANPVQSGGNIMEIVVSKATRFWQENRKNDFCEECDFERKKKRKCEAPDQIMRDGAEGLSPIEDEKMEESSTFSVRRFSVAMRNHTAVGSKSLRASIKQAATNGVDLPLVPLGGEHKSKQARLDVKPVITPPIPSREPAPPAAAPAPTLAPDILREKPYRIIDTSGVTKRAEAWEVFNAISKSLKAISPDKAPQGMYPYLLELVMEGPEMAKIRREIANMQAEFAANDGMLASANFVIKQSENCSNSFARSIIDQMKCSARTTAANQLTAKKTELKKYEPTARADFGKCEEFIHIKLLLQRLLPRVDNVIDIASVNTMDFAHDAYLPFLALNPELAGPPAALKEIIDSTVLAEADLSNARKAASALRQDSVENLMCEAKISDCDAKTSAIGDWSSVFNSFAHTTAAAPCFHMAYYCSFLASLPDCSVKIVRLEFGWPDGHLRNKAYVASLFLHYNKAKKSLQISDLAFVNFGFDKDIAQRLVDRKWICSSKLKEVIQSLISGKGHPTHVICPRWMASRVKFIFQKDMGAYSKQKWKKVRPQVGYTNGGTHLTEMQRCIFAPWWVELVAVPEKK
jgi:superfamily II DNA or RNA helicase